MVVSLDAPVTESFPPILRVLVDLRDRQVQKARIQFGNRLAALKFGEDPTTGPDQIEIIKRYEAAFFKLEEEIDEDIERLVSREPIFAQVIKIRGLGPMLTAKLLALIDITNKETPSQLWRFAGYGVVDGHAEKPVKGEKLTYSQRLKTTVFLVGESFIKSRSPYRRLYDESKPQYAAAHPEWTPMHIHRAAHRKMVKLFLQHLWLRWRELEGLPIRQAYPIEYMAHVHRPDLDPEVFGWP